MNIPPIAPTSAATTLPPAKLHELAAATCDWDSNPLADDADTLWPIRAGELRELLAHYCPAPTSDEAPMPTTAEIIEALVETLRAHGYISDADAPGATACVLANSSKP